MRRRPVQKRESKRIEVIGNVASGSMHVRRAFCDRQTEWKRKRCDPTQGVKGKANMRSRKRLRERGTTQLHNMRS